jgi:hypothetical protein
MTLVAKEPAVPAQASRKASRQAKASAAQGLSAWHCTIEPKRHVEVVNLGIRPLRDCTTKGCTGVMVHWGRVRTVVQESIFRRKRSAEPRIVYRSGYVCVENAEHFEPDFAE